MRVALSTQGTSQVLQDERVSVAVVSPVAGRIEVQLSPVDQTPRRGSSPAFAVLRGVRLVTGTVGQERQQVEVPFAESVLTESGSLRLTCPKTKEHAISVELSRSALGEIRCDVESKVDLRSRVFELTLDWRVALDHSSLETSLVPHPHESPDEVAGDIAFHAPITYLRAGPRAFALTPDLARLASERRIQQAVEVRSQQDHTLVRHGLIAHQVFESKDRSRFSRILARPVELRAERVRFSHFVQALSLIHI